MIFLISVAYLVRKVAGQLASWRFAHRYNALLVDVIIKMSPPRLGLGATAHNQVMNGL